MSGGPLARESLLDGLAAHMAASLGIDPESEDEMAGCRQMAEAAASYFSSSVRGAPAGAGQTLLWTIYSALWENSGIDQTLIDQFFQSVRVDPAHMLRAWLSLTPEERRGEMSIALVPGRLSSADINAVVASLFHSRGGAGNGNTPS